MPNTTGAVRCPGRVNLIGEHIDYHGLPVLPIAIQLGVTVTYRLRADRRIEAGSANFGRRAFDWSADLQRVADGDWENYIRAAARVVDALAPDCHGIDAEITSDLPPAAGLSSSSALLIAVTLAILRANNRAATFEQLMDVLPDGEQFVGTRGGGMDHAACLASRAGCASLIEFNPMSVTPIPIPRDWVFLIADSMQAAEKSGPARDEYNARRAAGVEALKTLHLTSYREAKVEDAEALSEHQRDPFLHVVTEAQRVRAAVDALRADDPVAFGRLMTESHDSLRTRLRVSTPKLDALVASALDAGAYGARLTGAGFGGSAVILSNRRSLPGLRTLVVEPSSGVGTGLPAGTRRA